jgi:hypothetical protein
MFKEGYVKARGIQSMLFGMTLTMLAAGSANAQTGAAQTTPPPPPAQAQTPAEPGPNSDIAFGYSFLREAGVDGAPANVYSYGWTAAYARRLFGSPFFGVGEVNGHYRHENDELWQLYGYLGGVRVNFFRGGPFTAFGQALFGVENFRSPGFSENGFASQLGGGVDMPLGDRLKFRFQADFRLAHQSEEDTTFKELRLAGSVVIPIR